MDTSTPQQNSTPVMPPPPVQESNSQTPNSTNSSRNTLFLVSSILIFVLVVAITLYLVVQNQKEQAGVMTEDKIETEQTQADAFPTLTQEQQKEVYGDVICRRFTSIEEALQVPEIACVLDLSGQDLTELPEYITKLTKLNELDLSDNNFTEFPQILYQVKTLLSINLENNQLKSMPEDISVQLPLLQSIRLEGNNLPKDVVDKYIQITPAPQQQPAQEVPPKN